MKLGKKILISILFILAIYMIAKPNQVNAALQANGGDVKTDALGNWILNIRSMEATGGTLGLTDTIDTTNLESSSSTSNNMDIHMEKNTEYGAMAILSASAYGNQNVIASGETTTGNKTGVLINLNKEWVSAGSLTSLTAFTNANAKYKNSYTTSYVAKVGDAISETTGWHGSGSSTWINNNVTSGLLRAYSGSLFSYYGNGSGTGADANYSRAWSTRAVIVVGSGF